MVRYGGDGVYVGIRADVGAGATAVFWLLQGIARPPQEGPRARIDAGIDGAITDRYYEGEREVPFPDGWTVKSSTGGGTWSLEMFVPLAVELGASTGLARAPWRFNVTVEAGDVGTGAKRARWGAETVADVVHGAILDFSPEDK
jgi:hypothetical protein